MLLRDVTVGHLAGMPMIDDEQVSGQARQEIGRKGPGTAPQLAVGGPPYDLLVGTDAPCRRRLCVVRRDFRNRLGGVPPSPGTSLLDPGGKRRRRTAGPHRHRGGGADGHRCRILHHHSCFDSRVAAVRSSHDAELRAGHRQSGQSRRLRGDLCLLSAESSFDHERSPDTSRPFRTETVNHHGGSPASCRPGCPHLHHPPHRKVDPTA